MYYVLYVCSPNELLLCNSFAPKFSGRYTEPAEYALYAQFKALFISIKIDFLLNLLIILKTRNYFDFFQIVNTYEFFNN